MIDYARPPSTPFVKRYDQGVLKSLEHSTLVYIASKHKCVLRVLPRYGDYINEGDPIVEVYGATGLQPEQVVKAVYAEIEAGMGQYPLFGIRMLADMAVQALPPSGNASTTVPR